MVDILGSAAAFAAWAQECGWDPAWSEQALADAEFSDSADDLPFEKSSLVDLPPLDTVPMVVEARLEAVRVHLAALVAELPAAVRVMQSHELVEALESLQQVANLTAAADQAVVAETDRRGVAVTFGATSTAALLIDRLRLAPGEAKRRVATSAACGPRVGFTGEPLPPLRPAVAAAQARGELSAAHATAIARGLNALPDGLDPAEVDTLEQVLVELAGRTVPGDVARAARYAADRFEPDAAETRAVAQARRRTLHLHQDPDGTGVLTGTLTPELSAQLQAVLSPLSAPQPADENSEDERTPGQRRHDALADVCARLLRSGTLPDGGGTPATVAVTIPLADLRAHAAAAAAGVSSAESCTTTLGTDLSITAMLHLACEADIIPVVLDDTGGIMSYGRTKRRATPAQRQALRARDGGCSFPGCTRPPEWCEAHHVREWLRDHGDTDLDNLTLLCGHHHRNFHRWGWTVQMTEGVPWWTPPAHLDPGQKSVRNTAHG